MAKQPKNFFSVERAKVLSFIKKYQPLTITTLAKKLGKGWSRTKVYFYLKELKERGLILEYPSPEKKGKRVPKLITLSNRADPIAKKWFDLFERIFKAEQEIKN